MLKLAGVKSTFLSLLAVCGLFLLLTQFQTQWQSKLSLINNLVYPLLIITAVFATLFNRSRVAILCAFWLLYLCSLEYTLPWSSWLKTQSDWVLLCAASLLMLLAVIKDRALLSIHTVTRVLLIIVCGGAAFAWLVLSQYLQELSLQPSVYTQLLPYLPIALPLSIISCLLIWQSLKTHNLTHTALLITFIIWCLNQQHIIDFPWSVIAMLMASLYLLAVSIDSYYLAYRDDLTSLPTRRALNQLALSLGRRR